MEEYCENIAKLVGRVPGSLAFDNASGRSLPRRSLGPLPKKFDKSPGRGELAYGDQLRCLCSLERSLHVRSSRLRVLAEECGQASSHFPGQRGKEHDCKERRGSHHVPGSKGGFGKTCASRSTRITLKEEEKTRTRCGCCRPPRERKPKETTRESGALTTSQTTMVWSCASGTPRANWATAQILVQRAVLIDANIALGATSILRVLRLRKSRKVRGRESLPGLPSDTKRIWLSLQSWIRLET